MRANWDLWFALREADRQQFDFIRQNPDIDKLLLKWEYTSEPLAPENSRAAVQDRTPITAGR